MTSASLFFSISTRRVSLYQRARHASFIRGTLPVSKQRRDEFPQAPPPPPSQESTIHEKGEEKPKPKLYTELGGDLLKIHSQIKFEKGFLIRTSLLYDKKALAFCDKRTRQLFDEVRKERLSFGHVESGNKNNKRIDHF